jgi:hypothetical protein
MVPVLEIVLAFMGSAKGKFFEKELPKRIVLDFQAKPFGSGGLDFLQDIAEAFRFAPVHDLVLLRFRKVAQNVVWPDFFE